MSRFKNKAVLPQGMIAPSGYYQDAVDPVVQSTVRPFGTLLKPSPGYDSVRVGKNRFQGKGPTGGFRMMEFAEDVGGTGAALAVIPGDTTQLEASEWLPEDPDSLPDEGRMIIADRGKQPAETSGFAQELHEAYDTIPDMGDRHPARPLSKSKWLVNPVGMFRADYRESPAITVAATGVLICLITYISNDLEKNFRARRRGGGVASTAAATEVAPVETATDSANKAVETVSKATDEAVNQIGNATEDAVKKISDAANAAAETVSGGNE